MGAETRGVCENALSRLYFNHHDRIQQIAKYKARLLHCVKTLLYIIHKECCEGNAKKYSAFIFFPLCMYMHAC